MKGMSNETNLQRKLTKNLGKKHWPTYVNLLLDIKLIYSEDKTAESWL